MAHEINNPLTFVDTNLRWALERLDDPGGGADALSELRSSLTDALDGATRVREIVQELRRLARPPQTGTDWTDEVEAELAAAVGIARRQVQARARLVVEVEAGLPAVRVSRHQLGQVVVNLLVNAAQAIPAGRAAEQEVRVACRRDGADLVLEVRDDGPGIPADVLPHIFDPFYTTKEVGAGTGLGLAVCHGIVHAGGGTILAESEPGRGTAFVVRLPAAPAAPPRAVEAPPLPAVRRRRVLIIDDEPQVARALSRALSHHEVAVLGSAREALRRLAGGERWDLVLCDLLMPDVTGAQFADALRATIPDALPHLVLMTGAIDAEPCDVLRAAGITLLEKPIRLEELRRLLDVQ